MLKHLRFIGRSLRHRNFRLFFIGQSLSLVGTWMQQVAISWLVYRMTGSALLLGVVAFASQAPTFVLSPYAGVMADKRSRHRMILLTQGLSAIQATLLAVLVLTGSVTVPWLIGLSFFIGLVNAFDIPARQSFIVEMIDHRDDLGNALALHSTIFNSARLVGPALAGVIIAVAGEWPCFVLNALSYLPILWALSLMRFPKKPKAVPEHRSLRHELEEAFAFAFHSQPIRLALLMVTLGSVFGAPYNVLLPVFAKDILGGGPATLGFLVASSGLGALTSALYMASRREQTGLLANIANASGLLGLGLTLFSMSHWFAVSALLMWLVGFGMMTQMISANTLVQCAVDDRMRGRVMSLYTMAVIGMAPVGGLLAGALASRIGAPRTLFLCGLACLLGSAWLSTRIRSAEAPLLSK